MPVVDGAMSEVMRSSVSMPWVARSVSMVSRLKTSPTEVMTFFRPSDCIFWISTQKRTHSVPIFCEITCKKLPGALAMSRMLMPLWMRLYFSSISKSLKALLARNHRFFASKKYGSRTS